MRAVIHRRLTLLDEETRQALEVAAVCGLAFEEGTVRGVLGEDLDSAVAALDKATAAGLLREEGAGQFSFTHALVRHSVLDDLSQTRAARLHWRIAESFEQDPARRLQRVGEIAYHYSAGSAVGPADIVARAAVAAGDEAMRRLAFDEAANHFRTALDALDRMAPDPDLRYRPLTSLGQAMNALDEADLFDQPWLQAARIARSAGDPERLFAAILGYGYLIRAPLPDEVSALIDDLLHLLGPSDSALRATALGWRALPLTGGDLAASTPGDARLADEGVAMARRVGDPAALVWALRARVSLAGAHTPDAQAMLGDAEELAALRVAHGDAIHFEAAAESRELTRALLRLGRRDEAERELERAKADAEQSGLRLAINTVLIMESALAAAGGRFDDAVGLAAEAATSLGRRNRLAQLNYGAQVVAVRMEEVGSMR